MADMLLTPVFERVLGVLTEEFRSWKSVGKEVESLKEELEIIQRFLRDAEEKAEKGGTKGPVEEWLKQMRELGNRIEDVVDDFIEYAEKRRGSLSDFMKKLKFPKDMASEITNIHKTLGKMRGTAQMCGLQPLESQGSRTITDDSTPVEEGIDGLRLGSLFIGKDELVGIDSISKELVDKLIKGPFKRMALSLVGEGGIGKTTLAKTVYDNEAVEKHFVYRAWINVPQSYDTMKLLKDIIKQIFPAAEQRAKEISNPDELSSLLKEHLKEKKYVIVFDDVWRADFWEAVELALPAEGNQGRVIFTTRNATLVANAFNKTPNDLVQELKPWSEEFAWKLFCKKAFRYEIEEKCPEELKQLSLEFVNRCQGLPLVIAVIGSLLSKKKKDKSEWEAVLVDLNSASTETSQFEGIFKVLSYSYFDLPYHLKRCFMYFGTFPEDFSLIDVTLYKLWIAEGLVESSGNKTLEQVAEEYLNELIQRNLVAFDVPNEVERWCRVHDLMREIILSRATKTSFFWILDGKEMTSTKEESRRLAIHNTAEGILGNVKGDGLHSISIFNGDKLTKSFVAALIKRFKRLRVLNFNGTSLDELPDNVGDLFHLKYLGLGDTKVKKIPTSIGKLLNLQTLDVRNSLVSVLPIEINKIRKLRHLLGFSFENNSLQGVRIQGGVGDLRMLQTLSMVKGDKNSIPLKDLEELTEMRQLGISELTMEAGRAICASVEKMIHLKCLDLYAITDAEILDLRHISNPPPKLEYLATKGKLQGLPDWIPRLQNLQKLCLSCASLTEEPLASLKDMPHLVYLDLNSAYEGEELHFEKGGFPKLKELILKNLKWLKAVKIDGGALSNLEKLEIGPSHELKEVPTDITNLRNLKYLDIWEMPDRFMAAMQKDGGPQFWKIEHVTRVRFWRKQGVGNYVEYKLPDSHPDPHPRSPARPPSSSRRRFFGPY